MRLPSAIVAGMLVALAAPNPVALAQANTAVDARAQEEADRLFREVLRDPSNVALNQRYADAALRASDIESAMGALERLLVANPDQPEIRLKLSQYYEQVGALTSAVRVLLPIRTSAVATAAQKEEANRRLNTSVGALRGSRSRVAGAAQVGIRAQSNANSGPIDDQVRIAGTLTGVSDQARAKTDAEWYLSGYAEHTYDVRDENDIQIRTLAAGRFGRSIRMDELSSTSLQLRSGPSFLLAPTAAPEFRLYPFFEAGATWSDDDFAYRSLGGGFEGEYSFRDGSYLAAGYTYRDVRLFDAQGAETRSQFSGKVHTVGARGALVINNIMAGTAGFDWVSTTTRVGFNDYNRVEANVGSSFRLQDPFGRVGLPWLLGAEVNGYGAFYDAADPAVVPNTVRRDTGIGAEVSTSLAVVSGLTVRLSSGVQRNFSNIENYDYLNVRGGISLQSQF